MTTLGQARKFLGRVARSPGARRPRENFLSGSPTSTLTFFGSPCGLPEIQHGAASTLSARRLVDRTSAIREDQRSACAAESARSSKRSVSARRAKKRKNGRTSDLFPFFLENSTENKSYFVGKCKAASRVRPRTHRRRQPNYVPSGFAAPPHAAHPTLTTHLHRTCLGRGTERIDLWPQGQE